MTLFILIIILAYLVAIIDCGIRIGKFLEEIERDARQIFKKHKRC
jgi:hypothetical protein